MSKLPRYILLIYLLINTINHTEAQVVFQSWSLEQARQSATTTDKLFFLYFTADWCAPCQWMHENTFQDAQLTAYVQDNYMAVKVDIDHGPAALLRQQFKIEEIPNILVFSAAGQLIEQHIGTISAQELQNWLTILDHPSHHIHAVQAPVEAEATLSSPQAHLNFSRPALGKSQPLSLAPQREVPSSDLYLMDMDTPILADATEESFAPRDGSKYTILLTDYSYSYEAAISALFHVEKKYQQRTELQPQGDGKYRIVIGEFIGQQAAQKFLVYLQRNDRQGEILRLDE